MNAGNHVGSCSPTNHVLQIDYYIKPVHYYFFLEEIVSDELTDLKCTEKVAKSTEKEKKKNIERGCQHGPSSTNA